MAVTHVISGTSNKDARVYVYTTDESDSEYTQLLGYKDITAGNYSIVMPETRPAPITDDDFTGTNGDPPNSAIWEILQGDPVIDNNDLYMEHPAGSGIIHEIRSKFWLSGDFRVDVAFNFSGQTNSNGWYAQLSMIDASGENGGRAYGMYGRRIRAVKVISGVDTQTFDTYMGTSWNTAGVSLARGGSGWVTRRKSGASWYHNIGGDFTGTTNDVRIEIKTWHVGGLPAFNPYVQYMETVAGDPIRGGNVIVNIFAVASGTNDTDNYGSVQAGETTDAVTINQYPWP